MPETHRINTYANAMFHFEHLNDAWIDSCATYLLTVFGKTIKGRTVIDYAFGRGNWSLAFLRCGAKRVIAIDASRDNVKRFGRYCHEKNVHNIEIICGNILETDLQVHGDIIWVYGLLNHIRSTVKFIKKLATLASGPTAQFLIYHYDAGSLRELIVLSGRRKKIYRKDSEYLSDSFLFVQPAHLRARDDLIAPYVRFSTAHEVRDILAKGGIYVVRQVEDFDTFHSNRHSEEFRPHHMLCSLNPTYQCEIIEPPDLFQIERAVLSDMVNILWDMTKSKKNGRNVAIGLYNTYFASLRYGGTASTAIIEIFIFLYRSIRFLNIPDSELSSLIYTYVILADASREGKAIGEKRQIWGCQKNNIISEYLLHNNVRI